MAVFAAVFFIFGCKTEVSRSDLEGERGSISLSFEQESSRALFISELKSALVTVSGYDSNGKKFEKQSAVVPLTEGRAASVQVEDIPICKNAAVKVNAYSDTKGSTQVKGGIIYAYVAEITSGENAVTVGWDSSKKGSVYYALISADVNTNILTDEQLSSINNAIPSETHASLINAASIASDYKSSSLNSSASYILSTGSVQVTCNEFDGLTLQVCDPLSSTATASTSSPVTIDNVTPGTWTLYVLEGNTVKTSKSVTVTSGETTSVTVGSAVVTDKIIVHVSSSSTYNPSEYSHIWVWSTSGSPNYCKNSSWPGDALADSDSDGWYDYTIMNGSSYVTTSMVILNKKGSPQTGDITISVAGEYWWNGSAFVTENPDLPPEPVAPTVSISPSDGSKIALNGSISVTFDDGNDTITSAKVTVNGTEYNMGTTAGTWSKSLSDMGITSEGATVTVSASVTNSVGTGSASASLTTKEANKLVTNPNELRIYQVMVSSFQDGDSSIGYTDAHGPSNALKGGDLQGIINALDYIKSLGCNALWMTPIFESNGTVDYKLNSTGYFAGNYFKVDPNFGTNEKFAELVELFHNNGIAVILDGVFGHTSAAKGGYVVQSPKGYTPSGSDPVNYTDTNTQEFFKEVAEYWIKNYKIDGWRLDQCYQVALGENATGSDKCNTGGHNYWYDIRKVVEAAAASNGSKGNDWGTLGYMVGEHWRGDATLIQNGSVKSGTAAGYGLNSCFDFPAYYQIVQGFAQEWDGKTTGNITTGLSYLYKTYTEKGYSCKDDDGTYDIYYPNVMLSNHDLYRIGDLIQKKWSCAYESNEYVGRNKVLLAAQCAYSGPITIYYGDEIGARSADNSNGTGWYADNVARSSGKISGFTTYEQQVHDWTQKCLEARADHEALWNGTNTQITGQSDFYVAKKEGGGETIYIAFNYNSSSSKTFSASGKDLISGQTFSGTVTVPALSAVYILAN